MKKVLLGATVLGLVFSANAKDLEDAEISTKNFSSVYAGIGGCGNFQTDRIVKGAGKDRFMGSFVVGAGKQFSNNVYLGAEFLGDFSKSVIKKFEKNDGLKTQSKASVGGFVPTVSVKLGYVFNNDVLAYGKMGVSSRRVAVEVGDFKDSKRKPSFVLGAGVEKAFCKKFSTALEAEYDFGYNWKRDFEYKSGNVKIKDKIDGKNLGRSWNIRALVKYNIKY